MRIAIGSPGKFRQPVSIRVAESDSTELTPEVAQSGKISFLVSNLRGASVLEKGGQVPMVHAEKVSDTNSTGFEPRALAVGEENVVRMRRRPTASARGSLRQPKFVLFVSDTFSLVTTKPDAGDA